MIQALLCRSFFQMATKKQSKFISKDILVNDPSPMDILINDIPSHGLKNYVSGFLGIEYLS